MLAEEADIVTAMICCNAADSNKGTRTMKRSETIDLKGVKPAELVHGSGELSDAALDQVAGGFASFASQAWMTCLKSCADFEGPGAGRAGAFQVINA